MSAWFLTSHNRDRVIDAIALAPAGARVTLEDGPPRTNPQNRLMWRLLTCFSKQLLLGDKQHEPEIWKCAALKAFGKELQFVPSLDGRSVVAIGYRSSLLTTEEMAAFIEFLYSEGAQRGVDFDEEKTGDCAVS
jgi:hypothetical protein